MRRCKCYYWHNDNNGTSLVKGMCDVRKDKIPFEVCLDCEIKTKLDNPTFTIAEVEEEGKPKEIYWFSDEYNILNPFADEQDKGMEI